jgi:tRNA A37 threonylcarbamoyladenosine modification protein TsaB
VAQGWQLALPVKLLGIGSADCLAAQAQQRGWFGTANIAIDAQRNEFYLARYEIDPKKIREIAPLKLASFDEVVGHLKTGEIVAGPDADKAFAGGRALYPGAATVGLLAVGRTDFTAGEKLEPVYLRETSFVKAPPPRILPGG